ncbi:ankyrin repeat domain-containing protein [bacterium]|nr:ankyrin repeat domain-containing protein [bacterium]
MKHLLLTIIGAVVLVETAFANPIQHAVLNGDLVGVQSELDKGVDVNLKGRGEFTPLHYAAAFGQQEIAALLIRSGADVNAKDENDYTPLHLTTTKQVAELLIANGAKVEAKGDDGFTPLFLAAINGYKENAELFLANGTNVNAKDEWGWTPLHYAANIGYKEIAELLIAKGANVNAQSEDKSTALHTAAYWGQKKVAELLIAKGGDVNAKDEDGGTPLDVAEEVKDWHASEDIVVKKETADLLHKNGCKTGKELAMMPRLVQHGRFAFSFDAKEGKVYEVQDSFNLLNWEVIKTYNGTGDSVRFDEERDHDPPQWFYRVRVVD